MRKPRKAARLARKLPQPGPGVPSELTPPGRRLVVQGMESSSVKLPGDIECMVLRLHGLDGNGEHVWFDVGVEATALGEFQVAMQQAIRTFKEGKAHEG